MRPLLPWLPACLPWVAPTRDWLDSRLGRTSGKARRSVRWSGTTRSAATWHARAKPSPTASLLSTFLCHATRHLPTAQRGSRRSARGGTSVWEAADNASGGVEVPGASRVEAYYSRITAVYSTEKRRTRSRTSPALPRHRPTAHRGPALTSGVRLSPACTRGPLDCRVTVTSIISQAPTALPLAGRAHVRPLRRRSHLGSCQGQGSKKPYSCARHTTHTKPQYRGAGARSRQSRRPAGSRPARPSVPSRLAARRSPTWAGVTPPFAALAASLPTGPRAPLEPDPRLQTSPATIAVAATILTAMAPAPRDLATHFSPFIGRDQGYQASHGRQHI